MNEMVNRINASLEEMQVKIDDYEGSMEAVKIRISDTDVSNRARLQQVSDTLQASIAEHAITLVGIKELTTQKLEEFSERLQEVPRQLQVAEEQYEDFRRKLLEFNRTDSEKLNQLLGSMRESVSAKVSEQEFDRLQGEIRSSLQRILSQQEMEQVTAEQTRLRIQEVEAMTRERHRELKAAQERAMEDQLITMRVMKEASSKRLEDIDAKLAGLPKSVELAWMEIRKLHSDVDEKLRLELGKVERDLALLKGEVGSRVTEKSLDLSIKEAVSPVSVKLERIYHEVDELKYASERMKAEIKSQASESLQMGRPPLPTQMGSVPPKREKEKFAQDSIVNENGNRAGSGGNYYKPDFGKDAKLPPLNSQANERTYNYDVNERNLRTESPRVNYQEPPIQPTSYIRQPNNNNQEYPSQPSTYIRQPNSRENLALAPRFSQSEAQPPQDYPTSRSENPTPRADSDPSLSRRESLRAVTEGPPQLKNFVRGSDPELERLADLALAGSSLPPLPRKPSFGGGNAEF